MSKNELKTGFSCGQMFHFMQMKNIKQDNVFINEIKKQAPKAITDHLRFSGTAANYSNLNIIGYGMPSLEAQIKNQKRQQPTRSYIYDFVELYQKLNAESSAFTFNSHQPYLKKQDLEESLKSLEYVDKNTNLTLIELSNEAYLSIELLKLNGNFDLGKKLAVLLMYGVNTLKKGEIEKWFRKQCDDFLDYLEFTVVPEIRKRGITAPLGLELSKGRQDAHKIWNEAVLSRDFYDELIIHTYFDGLTDSDIKKEFDYYKFLWGKTNKKISITEYGLSSSHISNNTKNSFQNESNVRKELVNKTNKLAKSYGAFSTYNHALWGNSKTYSFVDYKN